MLLSNRAISLTVARATPGEYLDGDWQPGEPTTLTVRAHVQPAKGHELLTFSEGQRTREAIRIYADQELRVANEAAQLAADVVTYNGLAYQVKRVDPWPNGGLPHWKAIALRVPPPPTDV